MIYPGEERYLQMAQQATIIPVWDEVVVDLETPISIYMKIAGHGPSYLLESVEGGENLARYSFLGIDPFAVFKAKDDRVTLETATEVREERSDPLAALERLMAGFIPGEAPGLPRFYGGAVGYFGYDLVRHFECLPLATSDDLELPECCFIFAGTVMIFDHVKHSLKIVSLSRPGNEPVVNYRESIRRIEELKALIGNGWRQPALPVTETARTTQLKSNLTQEEFVAGVIKAKEYIKAGDIFQVVLSQRLTKEFYGDPFEIYRALRTINPSPYMFYLDFVELQLVGSSPEMLVRVEDGVAQTCPIAGTRPRGGNPEEDAMLAADLLANEKERAEHLMLVDLGRNDLGRVCRYGSVQVGQFMEVERYSHVMHLVSTVQGDLKPEKKAFDALRACFPAGTVSGAPKIRAMEIIEEIEPTRRGPYAGAIGYLSFSGNLDTCITIRTIMIKDNNAYLQAGAGIVADSDPLNEYEETLNKARALVNALEKAERSS